MIQRDPIATDTFRDGIAPDPIMAVSEHADLYRYLPKESSSEPGKYRTSRTPYLKEIMDDLSVHVDVQEVCVMKATQLGMTEAGNNWVVYIIDAAPGPCLMFLPTDDLAKEHSKQKLSPTIRDTPRIRGKVRSAKGRKSGNTLHVKEFDGGSLFLAGSNSPAKYRSKSIRFLILDDVDGFPVDVGGEGDPVTLAKKRTDTYGFRKKVYEVSTPTIKGASRIEKSYSESDQRHYHVPCPHCGHEQALRWGGRGEPSGSSSSA